MDMQAVMQQAQAMQAKMQELQESVAQKEFDGESGGGLVKIKLTGKGVVTKVEISDDLYKPDEKEVLEDLIAAAFNDTKTKIEDTFQDEMGSLAKELGLPEDFQFPA